jgi:2-polyprenyl-3-methyl-5-hydroxy-6-metoxy-1,4-benzoquinol methylase
MENPKKFWKDVHVQNHRKYLGLTGPKRVLALHKIDPKSLSGKRVMDFGVGDGQMHRHLQTLGAEVVAIDVVEEAMEEIEGEKHLSDNLKDCEPVDVVICNLVFLHCEDSEIQRIYTENFRGHQIKTRWLY